MRIPFVLSHAIAFFLFASTAAIAQLRQPVITLWNNQKYLLGSRIADGGFGIVYNAVALADQSPVALKFFRRREDYDSEAGARFKGLLRSQGKENVIRIFSKGLIKRVDGNAPDEIRQSEGVIAMEKVEGTLEELGEAAALATSSGDLLNLSEDQFIERTLFIRDLILQFMDLWAGLASNKLIHGDIKPANIGYSLKPFQIKLIDIGSIREGPLDQHSRSAQIFSTKGFIAPEVLNYLSGELRDGEYYSSFGDLYSIGATLLKLMCNECRRDVPYQILKQWAEQAGSSGSAKEALARLNFAADFIHAAMRTDPESRYREMRDGPLGKMLRFRAASSKNRGYAFMRVRALVTSPDEVEKAYLSSRPRRIIREKPARAAMALKAWPVEPGPPPLNPESCFVKKAFQKCANLLRLVFGC